MKNKIKVVEANKLFLVFTMLFFIFQVIIGILISIYDISFIEDNMYGILIINQFVLVLLPVLVYAFIKGLDFKQTFRFNKLGVLSIIIITIVSIPAYFVAVMLNTIVIYFLQFIGNVSSSPIPVPQNLLDLAGGILIVAVFPAICEEMLHRGIILKAYENRGTTKAVIISAIFFGIFHFEITNLLGPIFLGLLIGYYVVRTNSIFAGMLAHFLNNAIAEVLQYLTSNNHAVKKLTVSFEELMATILYGMIGLALIAILLYFLNQVTRETFVMKPVISSVREDIVSILSHWPITIILLLYLFNMGMYVFSLVTSKLTGN